MQKELSNAELKVLEVIAKGYKNRAAARILNVVPATINAHLVNIYSKLEIDNDEDLQPRVAAVRWFLKEF